MFLGLPPRHASSGSASRPEHALDAGVHFLFIDEFAAVTLLDALSDASSKARVARVHEFGLCLDA